MTAEVAAKMREMMRDVVEEGTATKLSSRPYNPCGKTGSAEIVTGQSTSHAWFTGFAPESNPEIAITVIVEGAGSGGVSAVPVARSVMDEYFDYTPAAGEDDDANYIMVGVDTESSDSSDPSASTGTTVTLNMDTDGDGIMDAIDTNGDGVADAYDLDGDGIPESSTKTQTQTNVTETTQDTTGTDTQTTGTDTQVTGADTQTTGTATDTQTAGGATAADPGAAAGDVTQNLAGVPGVQDPTAADPGAVNGQGAAGQTEQGGGV